MSAPRASDRTGVPRRAVLGGLGAAAAALLTACTRAGAPEPTSPVPTPTPTPTPGEAPARLAADLVGDGTTDNGPALQRHLDAGGHVVLPGPGDYLVDTPVFLDGGDPHARVVLDLAGGTLVAGDHLPTSEVFRPDPTTRWLLWPNTLRSAWDAGAGTVDVAVGTRATGDAVGALQTLAVRDGTFDGRGTAAGLVLAHRTGTELTNITMVGARALVTWHDYSDGTRLTGCHARHGEGERRDGALLEQVAPGDGLVISGCKADAGLFTARLRRCRGAVVDANVTGRLELDRCSGVLVQGGHQECSIGDHTAVVVRRSQVTFRQTAFYCARDGSTPAILVDDDPAEPDASQVRLDACIEVHLHDARDADAAHGPLLHVASAHDLTEVRAEDVRAVSVDTADPGTWVGTAGPRLTGAGPVGEAVQGVALVARGFTVSRRTGTWGAEATSATAVAAPGAPPAPTLAKPAPADGRDGRGSLRARREHTYWAAVRDADGRVSPAARTTVRTTATGAVRLTVTLPAAPAALLLWRGEGDRPGRHTDLPCAVRQVRLLDAGEHVEGVGWSDGVGPVDPTTPPTG
ncbi:hypothetical protein [Cellulomonas dongxiuzhuiae]|uniref:hypothetical protein n=1 Tax=Cellulomonas dongxiuzhuiae TaxID=2819979 RepID=UPI001AAE1C13|nr:hypothetical protein [Cellulomonas dongxiuzhuiae]MBO3088777.1 hypothetical protein [Cellulomonas dongxiuzhuiae]